MKTLYDLEKAISNVISSYIRDEKEREHVTEYHTCPQVLQNNVLIWKGIDTWYCADSDRNKFGFSSHPKVIRICKYCGDVLA